MSPNETALSNLGAVPIKARHFREEFFRQHGAFIGKLQLLASGRVLQETRDDVTDIGASLVSIAFESSLRGALYSSYCYFSYMDLHEHFQQHHNFEYSTAALDMAHTFAEVVPIELYNAREISTGPEFLFATGIDAEKCRQLFDEAFPKTKDARDAVAHYHDRAFSRSRKTQLGVAPLGRTLSMNGKIFTDEHGQDFNFQFEQERFVRYFSSLDEIIRPCA